MAKKNKISTKEQAVAKPEQSPKKSLLFNLRNFLPVATSLLYFAVHFIPDFDAYDNMGPQWLYMVGLDLAVIIFILARKDDYQMATAKVATNIFSKLFVAFFVLAGLSTFIAINQVESWVCYVRLIATIVAFFNISILLYNRTDLFKILAQLLSLILLVESVQTITQFLNGANTTELNELILSLKGTTGNKNIFAASTIVKIPFAIYCIHTFRLWGKILNIIILILGALTIFIVNARASYLSLILITLLYLLHCILSYFKEKKAEQALYRISYVLIPVLAALFVSQIIVANVKNLQQDKGTYGTVAERLGTVATFNAEDNQVRIRLWAHAIDYTKKHPIMGCGYGNWKISSIPYQKIYTNDLIVPVHSHNDYLEAFAELGILGGLLYFSLFLCIFIFTLKTYFSEADDETKLVSVFSFLAFVGYSVDAFFNFPGERPINQMFFAFITALNMNAFMKGREETATEKMTMQKAGIFKPLYGLIAMLLLLPSFYVTYFTYKSLIIQRSVLQDLNNEPLKLDWKVVVPSFPSIPNLSATGQPIESIKGRYLYEVGKYDEALVLLDKGRKDNPVIGYSEFLKAGLYFRQEKYDSAARNATVAFYTRPRAKTYYQTLIAVLAKQKDTANIKKAFEEAIRYRKESYVWNLYLMGMLNAQGKGTQHLLTLTDSSLRAFPNDSSLLVRRSEVLRFMDISTVTNSNIKVVDYAAAQKYYAAGVTAFGTGVAGKDDLEKAAGLFLKSSAINPGDHTALENAAICYFNMKEWKKSIFYFDKELAMKVSINGKPEYFKGVALINLGQKDEGCALLQIANKKGWKDAEAIIKSNCQ